MRSGFDDRLFVYKSSQATKSSTWVKSNNASPNASSCGNSNACTRSVNSGGSTPTRRRSRLRISDRPSSRLPRFSPHYLLRY